ncbi:hypothetical protein [Yeosuana sp.]|uniref:hypothetical protein n=1 Tax=Yeosuana sp. TaxID=2529388 RepID=UPI0040498A7C
MTNELKELISDYGGGRQKNSEKSQLFYELTNEVLSEFNDNAYILVEEFSEYLKEIAKRRSVVNSFGKIMQ